MNTNMPANAKNMPKKKILIVEDEKNIAQLLAFNLMQAGYEYDIAFDGLDGLNKAVTGDFDLILLDIMLPKINGYEVCRRLRTKISTPVIMLTARGDEIDIIQGLDLGADDYVTKPFNIKQLLSRVRANIRRASNELIIHDTKNSQQAANSGSENENVIQIRNLIINQTTYQVTRDGEEIPLTKKEYELLTFLAQNAGKICSREEILENVWGYEVLYGDPQMVDVTVSRLRKKLEADTANPQYFFTKRNVGYYVK